MADIDNALPENAVPARSRREILIGGACLAAAATAFVRQPRHHIAYMGSRKLEKMVPARFADWEFVSESGLILPPEDQLRDQIYSQLLTRTYNKSGAAEIMLLIAYNAGQDGLIQIHRPEVCYPASGFQLTRNERHTTRIWSDLAIPSRYIVAENSIRREAIVYWTRVGTDFPQKWAEQRLSVFEQNMDGYIPDGMLIRVSSVTPGTSVEMLDAFCRDLFENVGKSMQLVLVGESRA